MQLQFCIRLSYIDGIPVIIFSEHAHTYLEYSILHKCGRILYSISQQAQPGALSRISSTAPRTVSQLQQRPHHITRPRLEIAAAAPMGCRWWSQLLAVLCVHASTVVTAVSSDGCVFSCAQAAAHTPPCQPGSVSVFQ
jgi:hypothetical protein